MSSLQTLAVCEEEPKLEANRFIGFVSLMLVRRSSIWMFAFHARIVQYCVGLAVENLYVDGVSV